MGRRMKFPIISVLTVFVCCANGQSIKFSSSWPPKAPEFFDSDKDNIVGVGGKDYPIYASIPKTSFTCGGQLPGFYADVETQCQVFHLCINEHKSSFLCGNGTVFNQKLFTCNWWYNTTCKDSPKFYSLNSELYKVRKENKTIESPADKPKTTNDNKNNVQENNRRFPIQRVPQIAIGGPRVNLVNQDVSQAIQMPVPRQMQNLNLNSDPVVRHVLMGTDSAIQHNDNEEVESIQENEELIDENKQIDY